MATILRAYIQINDAKTIQNDLVRLDITLNLQVQGDGNLIPDYTITEGYSITVNLNKYYTRGAGNNQLVVDRDKFKADVTATIISLRKTHEVISEIGQLNWDITL